jgi:3-methyladenine DNA glycosylase/8-oxoguanine DNA glycosylase
MVPSLETIQPHGLERVVWLEPSGRRRPGSPRPVRITVRYRPSRHAKPAARVPAAGRLFITSVPPLNPATLRALAIRMFDLDANLNDFLPLALRDPVLAPVVSANPRGLRLLQLLDPFEALLRAILGQQVSVAAASTMTDRLVRLLAVPAPRARAGDIVPLLRPRYAFPRPAAVAELGPAKLRAIGLTRAKAASLHAAALAVASGEVDFASLRVAPADEVDRRLLALPGVGPWTAAYVRLRSLRDRDAFPAADLGLIRALAARGVPTFRIVATAESWRPWRGYATLHLWHWLGVRDPMPA